MITPRPTTAKSSKRTIPAEPGRGALGSHRQPLPDGEPGGGGQAERNQPGMDPRPGVAGDIDQQDEHRSQPEGDLRAYGEEGDAGGLTHPDASARSPVAGNSTTR